MNLSILNTNEEMSCKIALDILENNILSNKKLNKLLFELKKLNNHY